MMPARSVPKLRPIDRILSFFGIPAATRHGPAVRAADLTIQTSINVRTQAEQLTDAIRQLEQYLDRG